MIKVVINQVRFCAQSQKQCLVFKSFKPTKAKELLFKKNNNLIWEITFWKCRFLHFNFFPIPMLHITPNFKLSTPCTLNINVSRYQLFSKKANSLI